MKTKLLALLLGAALAGSSAAVLADSGTGGGHDRHRAEQGRQRHWDGNDLRKDRVHARTRHHAQRDRHDSRRGKAARHHAKNAGHAQRWPAHRSYRHYGRHPVPHARYHGHSRYHHRHAPASQLSIILHGHF